MHAHARLTEQQAPSAGARVTSGLSISNGEAGSSETRRTSLSAAPSGKSIRWLEELKPRLSVPQQRRQRRHVGKVAASEAMKTAVPKAE